MVASLSLPIDPHKILGVEQGASLQEIRSAFRERAKLYHPDVGGPEWAFRILVQAYEYLSEARVASRATHFEAAGRTPAAPPASPSRDAEDSGDSDPDLSVATAPPESQDVETIRPGVTDVAFDPITVVAVEKLWIRHQSPDPWRAAGGLPDDRFLSCTLNVSWPESSLAPGAAESPRAESFPERLAEVFDELRELTPAVGANRQVEDARFHGWLSYANKNQALIAFRQLRLALRAHGFRVKHWTRDLIIPRDGR